jgi:DNA-directed RNA polymerase specialized sigma24 family protein
LGTRGAGRNEHDLLSDAIIATLEGRRKWFKAKVDFMTFVKGVMRSLASHIRAGMALDAFHEIAPNPVNDEDDTEDFVEQIPTQAPIDPERQLLAGDLDRQVREHFSDDPEVLLIYEAFLEKMKPAEIQSCLGLTEKEYNAAAKRLRRAVRAFVEGGLR